MPTPTPSHPEHDDAPEMFNQRSCDFLLGLSERTPGPMGPSAIVNGIIAGVSISGVDLDQCRDEHDVAAVIAAYMNAGRRALLEGKGGGG